MLSHGLVFCEAAGLAPGVSNALAGAPPAPDSATKEKFVPTFVEALKWIEVAWEQIPQLVIKNSWYCHKAPKSPNLPTRNMCC